MYLFISTLIMWPMLMGVAMLYSSLVPKIEQEQTMKQLLLAYGVGIFLWISVGHGLTFGFHAGIHLMDPELFLHEETNFLMVLFQLCFYLYAISMLVGSVINRLKWYETIRWVIVWTLFVYIPLAYLFWNQQGWFYKIGALDFAGGIVVHTSAGVSSLVLAYFKPTVAQMNETNQHRQFLSTILIGFGWFGFNMGGTMEWNETSVLVFFNTIIAITIGALTWSLLAWVTEKQISLSDCCNGMILGLVSSTAGVAYIGVFPMMIVAGCACLASYFATNKWMKIFQIHDQVDSFAMNAIGGSVGAIGAGIFAHSQFVTSTASNRVVVQLGVLLFTIALSAGIMIVFGLIFRQFQLRITEKSIHQKG